MTSPTAHSLSPPSPRGHELPTSGSTTAMGKDDIRLRERIVLPPATPLGARRTVRIAEGPRGDAPRKRLWPQQADRILQFQRRWERIKTDLPPQLSRKHIGMISIGGVIGTGLFVGSADALRYGGPVGALLGYSVVGSVVYCLCVSVGEMIAFLPNVGGVVGLADLYVDPALGFSLGWAAWYNWSVTLPTEISAAALVIGYWNENSRTYVTWVSALYLFFAIAINCFPSRVYGQMEYILSCAKVTTIVIIIVLSLLIDVGASSQGPIGFRYWKEQPFAKSYLGIGGAKGQFLGFWAVIMQASFSFFGSEVPGIAAGEVIDATRNVPRALRKVWIRITLFYLGGILCSGLLVPSNNPDLATDGSTGNSSPFVIAFKLAGWKVVPDMVNASILLSAWSAAASDIYISSRFLFFLARRGHAPTWLAHLFRYPRHTQVRSAQSDSDSDHSDESDSDSGSENGSQHHIEDVGLREDELLGIPAATNRHTYVMPLASVLASSAMGLLTFMSYGTGSAKTVFQWLANVTSVASLQSWAGMLFTYIRWHHGTVYYEKKYKDQDTEEGKMARAQIETIKKNRQCGQPYLAWYAFSLCMVVLFTNGWAVFVHNGWRIADVMVDGQVSVPGDSTQPKLSNPVSLFLSAYVPLPFFLLLTFGYKLIKQTEMIPLDKMTFYQGEIPPYDPSEDEPKGRVERLLAWLMII